MIFSPQYLGYTCPGCGFCKTNLNCVICGKNDKNIKECSYLACGEKLVHNICMSNWFVFINVYYIIYFIRYNNRKDNFCPGCKLQVRNCGPDDDEDSLWIDCFDNVGETFRLKFFSLEYLYNHYIQHTAYKMLKF